MPREFRCPECKESISSFMHVGEKATCKACGKSVDVPQDALEVDAPPIVMPASPAATPEPAKIERLSPEAARLVAIGREVPPPTFPLYSLGAIYMAAFLGTFVAGFLLIRSNFRAVGDEKSARAQLGYMFGVLLLFLAAPFVPQAFSILKHVDYAVIAGVMAVYATRSQGAIVQAHRVLGGPFHSKWRAFWISMFWQAIFVAVYFLVNRV
jgi:hypothetical protein